MSTKALAFDRFVPTPRLPREAAAPSRAAGAGISDDTNEDTTRRSLLARLAQQPWWDAAVSNVYLENGTAVIQGLLTNAATRSRARRVALAHPGVHAVRDLRRRTHQWLS